MLAITHYNINPDTWLEDLTSNLRMKELFPEFYKLEDSKSMSAIKKISYKAGHATGKAKNFLSKTETKTATLIAYWAADSLVAITLVMTTTSTVAAVVAILMFALHTYATFSVTAEITK
jgi:hypothetical protein